MAITSTSQLRSYEKMLNEEFRNFLSSLYYNGATEFLFEEYFQFHNFENLICRRTTYSLAVNNLLEEIFCFSKSVMEAIN